jgi:uncharacterized protein YndB with AHSA1/START domain
MLVPILIIIAAVIIVFVIVVSLQPPDFHVTRSVTVSTPAAAVFALVNDLHEWEAWSPWEKMDPALEKTFEGPSAGTGASYSWAGNKKVGEGRMTITESHPGELIRIKLEFLKPVKATHTAEFSFKSKGNQTAITWSMFGKNNFMGKAMHLFMNMDKLIGGQFEKGLVEMKSVAEAASR